MAKNIAALQRALRQPSTEPAAAPRAAVPQPTGVGEGSGYKAPSREGKTNITAYLSPDYKASLRLIQARSNRSLQALLAEALNDLFAKYDVPTIGRE
jgi:hypothetical protein